jgi:hypothetical protein
MDYNRHLLRAALVVLSLISFVFFTRFSHVGYHVLEAESHNKFAAHFKDSFDGTHSCAQPISRSYLIEQYNIMLVADPIDFVNVGSHSSVTLRVCQVTSSSDINDKSTNSSFQKITATTPCTTYDHCSGMEINLWSRISSSTHIKAAPILPSATNKCEWTVDISPDFPGQYTMDIVNVGLRLSTGPVFDNTSSCNTRPGGSQLLLSLLLMLVRSNQVFIVFRCGLVGVYRESYCRSSTCHATRIHLDRMERFLRPTRLPRAML